MNKYIIFLIIGILLFPVISFGQEKKTLVFGTVKGDQNDVLESATVVISKETEKDGKVLYTTTDANGQFELLVSSGNFIIDITYLGYEKYHNKLTIHEDEKTNVGQIIMKPTTQELQNVIVQGQSVSVYMQPDGFSVNTVKLAKNSNSAFDLLGRLPTVRVKGDELKVIGKESVLVQINNVVQRVEQSELANILKGYDAALIEKVEVLTSPSLRYNTDGNTAMIILHTTSVFKQYMGGTLGTELMKGENHNGRYGGYASLVYNKKKLFVNIIPSYNHNSSYMCENTNYEYENGNKYSVFIPSKGDSDYSGATLISQYQYNKNGYFGVSGSINKRNTDNAFNSYESNNTNGIVSYNDVLLKQPKRSITAYCEQSLGTNNKVWLEMSYYNYSKKSDISYISSDNDIKLLSYEDNNLLRVSGYGINNDYSFTFDDKSKYKIDFGVNILGNKTRNSRIFTQTVYSSKDESFTQQNGMRLTENSYTPYISSTLSFSKFWSVRIGLKTSFTHRNMSTVNNKENDKNFISWLPNLLMSYSPSRNHRLNFTINSMIRQPHFSQINPFEWRVNNYSYYSGNPDLKPEIRYIYRLGYTYRGALSFAATIRQNRESIESVSRWDGTRIMSRTENAQNSEFYRIGAGYYFDKLSWMSFSTDIYCGKEVYHGLTPELSNHTAGYNWGGDTYFDFIFNKSRTFTAYLSGSYTGRTKTAVSTLLPSYVIDSGMSYFLFDRKLSITIAGIDIFSSRHIGSSERENYKIYFDNHYKYPTLYFSISYKFNNSKDSSSRRKMSTREIDMRF